jgi:hypothetical protein
MSLPRFSASHFQSLDASLQILFTEFLIDNAKIPSRVSGPLSMCHLGIHKAPDYMQQGIDLPNMSQKLVAESVALGRAFD